MEREKINIERAMDFAARAEDAYRGHGVDFDGMLYALNNKTYGWALPADLFDDHVFRDRIGNKYPRMHKSDGSVIEHTNGELTGPVTLVTPYADSYQHDIIHELGHQAWRERFTLGHKPSNGKKELPAKVCLAVGDGISEHLCYEEMHDMMDKQNSRIRKLMWKKYEDQLNKLDEFGETGFEVWKKRLSENVNQLGPDYRHAIGFNFALITWRMGMKLSEYLDRLEDNPPNEEDILNPMGYNKRIGNEL